MKDKVNKRILDLTCEKSYYIPNTKIRVDEHNPMELEELWNKLDQLNSLL